MQINIGISEGKTASISTDEAVNCHISITGVSGSGKSVAGQMIVKNIAEQGGTVVVFDMHRLFAQENILPALQEEIIAFSNDIAVFDDGLRLPLFTPLQFIDGSTEDEEDAVVAVATTLARPLRLGCQQRADLLRALSFVSREGLYEVQGIRALEDGLELVSSEVAQNVKDKLRYILKRNVFRHGEPFIEEGAINILRLSSFDLNTQALIAELVLSHLWREAQTGVFLRKPLWLFLDEVQNLPFGTGKGIVDQILAEGRKFGLNLILITPRADKKALAALSQAGTQLYFAPAAEEAKAVARALKPGMEKDLLWQLRSLKRGECFVSGALEVNGNQIRRPLRVRIG